MTFVEVLLNRAETLRALHRPGDPLVVVNVWDAASARVVAAAPGCRALATASWAIAAAHGYPDGEHIPLELMVAAIGRIAEAVELPVSADLEAGYGGSPDAIADSVARAVEAGAVGCNLEDRVADRTRLRSAAEHAEVVGAVRARGAELGVPVVINARTDVFLAGEELAVLDDAVFRGLAYLQAGADCVFAIGASDIRVIRELVRAFDGRVSVLARPGGPSLGQLAEAGVARVSFGPGPMGAAYSALADAAAALLARGAYPPGLAYRPPQA
jgi:2-methylisocitrate lyase-like PEP mutase family enzyme